MYYRLNILVWHATLYYKSHKDFTHLNITPFYSIWNKLSADKKHWIFSFVVFHLFCVISNDIIGSLWTSVNCTTGSLSRSVCFHCLILIFWFVFLLLSSHLTILLFLEMGYFILCFIWYLTIRIFQLLRLIYILISTQFKLPWGLNSIT